MVKKHFKVTGRVQGVFFRQSSCAKAQSLGLSGWVRNLPDGSVELQAQGEQSAVAELQAWLNEGPPHARVESVKVSELPGQEDFPFPFSVRPA